MIGAELERARIWEADNEKFKAALARTLEIIDTMIEDDRWRAQMAMLLYFREEIAKRYLGKPGYEVAKLYQAL